MSITLYTERLDLRPLEADDADFILRLVNDPDWLRFIGDRKVHTLADARRYIVEGPQASYQSHGFGLLLVTDRQSQARLGLCGLLQRDYLDTPDIGYAFLPEARGKGFAREAAAAILDAAHHKGMRRIAALVSGDNQRSIQLLRQLGMTFKADIEPPGQSPCQLYECDTAMQRT